MKIYFYMFFLTVVWGCSKQKNCECLLNQGIIEKNDTLISESVDWPLWENMKEPNIQSKIGTIYRLTKSPAWVELEKEIYILEKKVDGFQLKVKYINQPKSAKNLDSLERNIIIDVSEKEWSEFEELLESSCFWNMPSAPNYKVFDGVSLILEGKIENPNACTQRKYHLVGRKKGYETEEFNKICEKIFSLTEDN